MRHYPNIWFHRNHFFIGSCTFSNLFPADITVTQLFLAHTWDVCVLPTYSMKQSYGVGVFVPAGEENCSRTLLQPSVMMNDCFPTRLHSVSLETEHLNTLASSPENKGMGRRELGQHGTYFHTVTGISIKKNLKNDCANAA